MKDFGYDISDYCDVAPEYGTLADAHDMIEAAHARGGQVEQQGRTQAAGAHTQHRGRLETLLPLHAHLRQDQVPGESGHLIGAELNTADVGRKHGK